jgi:hypothetical protein
MAERQATAGNPQIPQIATKSSTVTSVPNSV